MKGKRDRSVSALLVLDVTQERVDVAGQAGSSVVPIINILTKRYGYRFGVSVFTRDSGSLAGGLEVPPDSAVLVRDGQAWLTPLLQSKGVSSLYLCGLVFELVAELAKEALKLGVVVFVIRDAVVPGPFAASQREELEKMGVNFVDSQRI